MEILYEALDSHEPKIKRVLRYKNDEIVIKLSNGEEILITSNGEKNSSTWLSIYGLSDIW